MEGRKAYIGKVREEQGERVFLSRPKQKKSEANVLQLILNYCCVVYSLLRNFICVSAYCDIYFRLKI